VEDVVRGVINEKKDKQTGITVKEITDYVAGKVNVKEEK
jgi:hypothetical protein